MNTKNLIASIFVVVASFLWSQVTPINAGKLPERIKESSGLICGEKNTFWTHNDGSDSGYIYQLNHQLSIVKKFRITNSIDKDVEEITQDDKYFYINDMGNNSNRRKDLRIYKIAKVVAYQLDSVEAELIEFSYEDQDSFPPSKDKLNFDCEAFIALDTSLYLFSKNRGSSSYSKIYRLPKTTGKYKAEIVDSFQTGMWVTGAAISPSQQQIAILAGNIIYLITNFSSSNFSRGKVSKFIVPYTQKEAIAFKDEKTLVLSDERNDSSDGCIYQINITDSIRQNLCFQNFYTDPISTDSVLYFLNYAFKPLVVQVKIEDINNIEMLKTTVNTRVGRRTKVDFKLKKGRYRVYFSSEGIHENYLFSIE